MSFKNKDHQKENMLTELVIMCIFVCIGIQIYYFTCRRQDEREDEVILLD